MIFYVEEKALCSSSSVENTILKFKNWWKKCFFLNIFHMMYCQLKAKYIILLHNWNKYGEIHSLIEWTSRNFITPSIMKIEKVMSFLLRYPYFLSSYPHCNGHRLEGLLLPHIFWANAKFRSYDKQIC